MTSPRPRADSNDYEIRIHGVPADRRPAAETTASQVARTGAPIIDERTFSACVPIRQFGFNFGSLWADVQPGEPDVASARELASFLDVMAQQAAIACRFDWEMQDRREDLELIATESGGSFLDDAVSLRDAKRAFERCLIVARLRRHQGNIAAAARSLNMDRGQLSRLVKRHEIDKGRFKRRRSEPAEREWASD